MKYEFIASCDRIYANTVLKGEVMNETIKTLMNHTSKRKFTEQQIEPEVVQTIVECAQMASTSSHFQSYTIIEVKDPAKRDVLMECSGGQKWTVTAP